MTDVTASLSELKLKEQHDPVDQESDSEDEQEIWLDPDDLPTHADLTASLLSDKEPIAKRMRCVFLLKQLGGPETIAALTQGLREPFVLLSHECAYALGQIRDPTAVPKLIETLQDTKIDPIVRHECAEALGAIGLESSLPILEKYSTDAAVEVSDTCKIAIDRIKWQLANKGVAFPSKYYSVDPAPAHPIHEKDNKEIENKGKVIHDVPTLQSILVNPSLSLFERYRAMFSLRDIGTEAAVLALATGFSDSSAVFRHEIAYVFGQLQHKAAVPSLTKVLHNSSEHAMVRHEAAEALGSIATDDVSNTLKQFVSDKDIIVKQSCDVALDLADYWTSDEISTALVNDGTSQ